MRHKTAKGKSAVVLLSGGVDSVTLLHYVGKRLHVNNIYALSFFYGQKHSRELDMAKWQAKAAQVIEHRVMDLSFFSKLISGSSALTDQLIPVPNLENLTEKQLSYLSQATKASNRLGRLAEDLLRVNQIDQDRIQFKPTSIHLFPILKKVVRDFKPKAAAKGVTLSLTNSKLNVNRNWIRIVRTKFAKEHIRKMTNFKQLL